ncbi:MAG: ABC transporter substrate-binding protein [Anaerolineales bacterium]
MGNEMSGKWRVASSKWGIGIAALLLLGLASLLLVPAFQPEDEAWKRIRERGVIVIATDASFAPFSAVDADGNLFGFDVDLGDELARRLGVRADYENITYDALLAALVSGRDDAVISALVAIPDKQKEVSYTRPYFVNGTAAVVKGIAPLFTVDWPAWAAGKRIAVEYGAAGDMIARGWAKQLAGITLFQPRTAQEALALLAAGDADAALVDAITAYEFLKTETGFSLAGPLLDPEPYVIAVNAGSTDLHRVLDDTLAAMERDGALAELRAKWFGEGAR